MADIPEDKSLDLAALETQVPPTPPPQEEVLESGKPDPVTPQVPYVCSIFRSFL